MTSNASSPTQRHAPAPLSPITTSSNVPPRGHTVRVASDASRSVLSTRSAPSFTSTNATNTYPPSSYASSSTGVPLARRILNHPSRTGAPLPPALSPPPSNKDEHVANDISRLNDEIYDFIALALRGYVTPWYSRLTPRDREFIPEINKAVVAVVQELDRRVRRADLDRLLLVDLPILVTQHYEDFRLARSKLGTSYAAGASLSLSASSAEAQSQTKPSSSSSLPPSAAAENPALAHIFHNIQSHLALNAAGEIDDTYLRQAVDHVLKTCLPPQDWASEMERSIVREIIVKPVLGSVLNKLSQPWFLHSILLSLLGSPRASESPTASPQVANPIGSTSLPSSPFKPQHFIILFLTLVQTISTFCLNAIAFFQRARALVHTVNVAYPYPSSPSPQSSSKTSQPQIPVSAPSIPSSGLPFLTIPQRGTSVPAHHNTPTPTPAPPIDPMETKEYATTLLEMLATMLTMQKRRASSTFLGMLDWSVGFTEGFLNRLLAHLLQTNLFTPSRTSSLLALGKQILFPNGYPGPPPIVPSLEEQILLRQGIERRVGELIPGIIKPYVLGPTRAIRHATIHEALEPISASAACNAHLVMLVFDAVLLTLFPEMGLPRPTLGDEGDGSTGESLLGTRSEMGAESFSERMDSGSEGVDDDDDDEVEGPGHDQEQVDEEASYGGYDPGGIGMRGLGNDAVPLSVL